MTSEVSNGTTPIAGDMVSKGDLNLNSSVMPMSLLQCAIGEDPGFV